MRLDAMIFRPDVYQFERCIKKRNKSNMTALIEIPLSETQNIFIKLQSWVFKFLKTNISVHVELLFNLKANHSCIKKVK